LPAAVEGFVAVPSRRPLRIFAFDPMLGRAARNRITVDIANERLKPGPIGSRVHVIDYDPVTRLRYPAVDLDDPRILMQAGLEPAESNPLFHQQMVYAVTMRVIENFERALGRRWTFSGGRPLRIYPHAVQEPNAFYDDRLQALLFGYFKADGHDVGANLPGQVVFTCLSQDIVAHEATHAMVDRLRPYLMEPSNPDVLAFHEGFADIVAILQHFSFPEVLAEQLAQARGEVSDAGPLVTLAAQFGYATGRGGALRSAVDMEGPDAPTYANTFEPHARGALLVAAVFDAFFSTYQRRVLDLLRIATGGTGVLPRGALHPDLVARLADEAATTARNVLMMCIRATELLPPVDVTFGDYLRALVTADLEVVPDDPLEQRNALIEGFRRRGIHPHGVGSLAAEALRWPTRTIHEPIAAMDIQRRLLELANAYQPGARRVKREDIAKEARGLHAYAERHREELDLDPDVPVKVAGFHVSQGWSRDGRFIAAAIIQFVQTMPARTDRQGGGTRRRRGGTTIVAGPDGRIRYLISKPLRTADPDAMERSMPERRATADTDARPSATGSLARLHRGLL